MASTPGTPPKPSRKPKVSVNIEPAKPSSKFDLSDTGTFAEDGVIINQDGLRLMDPDTAGKPSMVGNGASPDLLGLPGSGLRPRSASSASVTKDERPGTADNKDNLWWEVTSLDDLKVLGFVGRGSCGLVKKVLHIPTGKVLAVKIIPLDVDQKVRKQILLELRTLYKTSCPSIVPYHGAFYKDGAFYLVLEYADGGSLADLLPKCRGSRMPEPVIGYFACALLQGLAYLNRQHHVLHRDIKPSNMLLNRKGEIMVSDLGLVGQLANSMENAMSFVGTVLYMSPERIQGKEYSYGCDVWSLGLSFYECATGKYPFQPSAGKSKLDFFDIFHSIVQQPPPRMPRDQGYSTELCDFIDLCLTKEPELRPTAAKLLDHPFVSKYMNNAEFDVGKWLIGVIDSPEPSPSSEPQQPQQQPPAQRQ